MQFDIQNAGLWRRIATGLFDIILLAVLATGFGWGFSALLGTDAQYQAVQTLYDTYGEKFEVDFSITSEEFNAMSSEAQQQYNEAYDAAMEAMNQDMGAINTMMQFWYKVLCVMTLSVLSAHIVLEFIVPLVLKNGQTVGKKIFGIALMRKDGVMITPFTLFVRSILGKCTIEIMLPLLILFLTFMGSSGIFIYLLPILGIAQVVLLIAHPHKAVLHDLLACTVAVDISSQLIFRTPEALVAYQKERAAEKARKQDY